MLQSEEINALTTTASIALQTLQDGLARENTKAGRVRFPRGFIRTAFTHRLTLPNIGTDVQRRNASYALMTLDIFRWLCIRTDLSGAALSLIVKEGICVHGSVCEWLTKEATRGHASNRPYEQRTAKLVELGQIDSAQKDELDWIWEIRCNEHLHEVDSLEYTMYSREHYNRAVRAYIAFRKILVRIHGGAS